MSLYLLTLLTVVSFPSARFRHCYYYADRFLSVTKRNTDPVIRHNAYDDYRYEKRQNSLKYIKYTEK